MTHLQAHIVAGFGRKVEFGNCTDPLVSHLTLSPRSPNLQGNNIKEFLQVVEEFVNMIGMQMSGFQDIYEVTENLGEAELRCRRRLAEGRLVPCNMNGVLRWFLTECLFSASLSAEHPQTPDDNKLELHIPPEGLEGHAGLDQDLGGEDLRVSRRPVHRAVR